MPIYNGGNAYPRLTRHTENYPHYKGTLNIEHRLYYVAVWKRECEKDGVRYPMITLQIRLKDFQAEREIRANMEDRGYRKGMPTPGNGKCFVKVHRPTEKWPHYKGLLNVFGEFYYVSIWRIIYSKPGTGGELLKYPMLRIRVSPAKHFNERKPLHRCLTEFNKPAYLCDTDSQRRYLLDERDDPAKHADEYEYYAQQEKDRKAGVVV